MNSLINSRKNSNRGFTLVEIITVVVLLGILTAIGVSLVSNTATAGRANSLKANVGELNSAINSLRAAGTSFSPAGTYAVVNGSATTGASITMGSTVDSAALIAQLVSPGITSYGNTVGLAHTMTAASYVYTVDAAGVPTFDKASGAVEP